eukprot:CAMPEP_0113456582 /NCGR_PEP_ID=MMETSP0014_2-20120614/8962_1 /TAXON_ID=2857 /ORGANISM="Nitzschia sp." /LENGTH=591 /DNA_ID=CAMNT_0000348041 /DNA_START=190 /DNA_END=1965 /DNA_ORIENTATION=- /assembly_acc=CAM_ASM_000159
MAAETTEASKADRGGSGEYGHEQQLKPHPLLHPLQYSSQEVNGQDQHHLHFHPHPHPFVANERSAEHHQHHHHQHHHHYLKFQQQQQQQQQQQGDHEHKYDDKTDVELQEDEDFINKLAEATTQQELIKGGVATNKDAVVVEPVGVDESHPYPPPSRVCTDSNGDDPAAAAAVLAAGENSTPNNSSTMDTTAQDHAATLMHALSVSNITLKNDELSTETAGSAAAAAIATAAASSTSADRPIMETETHLGHPRYEVGQHDTVGLVKVSTLAAAATAAATTAVASIAHLKNEKPRPVSTEISDTTTSSSSSSVGGSTKPIPGVAENEAIPAYGAQAASSKRGVGKDGPNSHQGTQYKTGRWTVEEKIIFLHLLRRFGRGKWKNYQPYLPFRSIVQIKSHAQKVLKRQAKGDDIYLQLDEVQLTVEQLMEHVRRGDTSMSGGKASALQLVSKKSKTKSIDAQQNGRRAEGAGACDAEFPGQNSKMLDTQIHPPHPPHHLAYHQQQHSIYHRPPPNLHSYGHQSTSPSQYPGGIDAVGGSTHYHLQFPPPYFQHYQHYQQHHLPVVSSGMINAVSQMAGPNQGHSSEKNNHTEI